MTSINWEPYIQIMKQITGESPTRDLDTKGIPLTDPYAYHSLIRDMRMQHYGFLFIERIGHLWKIMDQATLSFNILETNYEEGYALGIVYGSLADWEETFIIKCSKDSGKAERFFYTLLFQCFEKSLLKKCFNLNRRTINDGTQNVEYVISRNV